MFELTFRRASVCMADDAGNGAYTLTLPDGAALSALVDAVLRGDRSIPYTGAHSCWRLGSDAGALAYVYTGADGEWRTRYLYDPLATLQGLGVTWVCAERAELPLTPERMERLYEEKTPAGRLVLQVNRTGCRVRETRLDGALRLIVRVGDYREGDIVLTARVQSADGRVGELTADASPCVVSEALPDGLRVVVPVERKRLSPTFPDFYITLTLAWASGTIGGNHEAQL